MATPIESPTMRVLIDGIEVQCLNAVKVIWTDTPDEEMEMHMGITHEGIILDTFTRQDDSDDTGLSLEKTMSLDLEFLEAQCI